MSKAIQKFVEQTGLILETARDIWLGEYYVGILNPKSHTYLAYEAEGNDGLIEHEVASRTKPDSAYNRGPFLSVFYDGTNVGKIGAIQELEQWIERIMAAGYKIETYKDTTSVAALMAGGAIDQKCLGGGVSFSKFRQLL